jgi:hypothetical protein
MSQCSTEAQFLLALLIASVLMMICSYRPVSDCLWRLLTVLLKPVAYLGIGTAACFLLLHAGGSSDDLHPQSNLNILVLVRSYPAGARAWRSSDIHDVTRATIERTANITDIR